jgi:hypothetical protein
MKMAEATFGSILDKPATDIERPKPLPPGTYHCVVEGQYREGTSAKKGTEFIEYSLKPIAALDDVDEGDLNASLKSANGSVKALSDKRLRLTFYLTDDSLYRLKDFLGNDLQIELGKKHIRQLIGEAQNRQVLAQVKHVPSDDGQSVFANIAKTAPVVDE